MITDTEIKLKGLRALLASLGPVETERFIALLLREPFDYTAWQRSLLVDASVDEISGAAMRHRQQTESIT